MARSRADKIREGVIQLLIIGLLAGFLPYILYRAACTETPNVQRINNQLDPKRNRLEEKPAPAPSPPAAPAPADPPAAPAANP